MLQRAGRIAHQRVPIAAAEVAHLVAPQLHHVKARAHLDLAVASAVSMATWLTRWFVSHIGACDQAFGCDDAALADFHHQLVFGKDRRRAFPFGLARASPASSTRPADRTGRSRPASACRRAVRPAGTGTARPRAAGRCLTTVPAAARARAGRGAAGAAPLCGARGEWSGSMRCAPVRSSPAFGLDHHLLRQQVLEVGTGARDRVVLAHGVFARAIRPTCRRDQAGTGCASPLQTCRGSSR